MEKGAGASGERRTTVFARKEAMQLGSRDPSAPEKRKSRNEKNRTQQ